jgi:membrane protein implicated in regulation of membrane protease activity
VVGKYLLLQIPGMIGAALALAAAVHYWDLSPALAAGLFAAWVLKDVVMFPFVRVAYESGPADATETVVGARVVAREVLDPVGYVRLGSELWRAELPPDHPPAPQGAWLRVRAVRGLTLLVEPEPDDDPARDGASSLPR